MLRVGLCCLFKNEPIFFKSTTARYASKLLLLKQDPHRYIGQLILHNIDALEETLKFCSQHGIGCFRINSLFLPLYTHPIHVYTLDQLDCSSRIYERLSFVKKEAETRNIRLTFHPDQFVVLNSVKKEVLQNSLKELEYHGLLAELIGADVITIHGGASYGNKRQALESLKNAFSFLSDCVRTKIALENDDRVFTPQDLLSACNELDVPLVYDVHHHRCNRDEWSIEEATRAALSTWKKEPLFHISSPSGGWASNRISCHADFIDVADMPKEWQSIDPLTVEVEAKSKELAVLQLRAQLIQREWSVFHF